MKILFSFSFLLFPFFVFAQAPDINEFHTDGCTLAPDGTFDRPDLWRECCVNHDLWYWGGGTKHLRSLVDKNLEECITSKAGSFIATLFYFGVRSGSISPVKFDQKKWGNAWKKDLPEYRVLNTEEKKILLKHLEHQQSYPDLINQYVQFLQNSRVEGE